jgi:two-component system response regulator RegA
LTVVVIFHYVGERTLSGELMPRAKSRRDVSFDSVLLVDDDPVFLRAFAREFERRGWTVFTEQDVFAAVASARSKRPEVVVLDLLVGEHSGLEIIEDLRHDVPNARIVMLTGSATVSTAVLAMKLGAHDYVEKPTTVDAIVAAVELPRHKPTETTAHASLDESEQAHIERVLKECNGNISEAARRLRMHRRSLQRKLRKSGSQTN